MGEVARADDQHTLILGHIGTLAVNPYIFDKLPYDADKDFRPISLLAKVPSLYVVQPGPAGEEPEGVRRAGQEQAGPAELRLGRQRQRRPPGDRVPEDGQPTPSSCTCPTAAPARSSPTCWPAGWTRRRSARRRCCSSSRPASCAASPPAPRSASPQLPDVPTVAEQGYPGLRDDAVVRPAGARPALPQAAADKLAAAAAQGGARSRTRSSGSATTRRSPSAARRRSSPPSSRASRSAGSR